MSRSELKPALERIVQRGRVLTAPAQLTGYSADGLGYKAFMPDAVVIPADSEELVLLLHEAAALQVPLTIRGAGTSLSGGPVAAQGGVIVHTSGLRKISRINADGFWCEVESGVVLDQLDKALLPHGLFYPPDPSSGPVCTLGGNVAMNAGGARCFRYGVTSNYVLGLEVVMLDGRVYRFGGPAGGCGEWREDWKRLMVGSEGTLGAFTRFWLRLLPRAEKAWTFLATFSSLSAAEIAIHKLSRHASFPVAIELMDPRCVAMVENSRMAAGLPKDSFVLVTEIDGPEVLIDQRSQEVAQLLWESGASKVDFSASELDRRKLWRARKVAGGLMGQLSPDFLVQDAVIPKKSLAEVLQFVYDEADAACIPVVNVFHAGDGNLHPNFLFDSRRPEQLAKVESISKRLMQRVVEVGGALSGEHGIGNDKSAYMPFVFNQRSEQLQLSVPRLFNPSHQLNPLKVFSSRRFEAKSAADRQAPPPSVVRSGTSMPVPDSFEHFFDPIDGIVCISASATAPQLAAVIAPHRFRYPLILDDSQALLDQFTSSSYAPASSRFGPCVDNIVGMNWQLPSGERVRIGERVVKTTTGYDLLRFLLTAHARLGVPLDFVLRLRPDCGGDFVYFLEGDAELLRQAAKDAVGTCWAQWFDSVDLIIGDSRVGHQGDLGGRHPRCVLRFSLNCAEAEKRLFENYLEHLASVHRLSIRMEATMAIPRDGCPDLVLKLTPDTAPETAFSISEEFGIRCHVYCAIGVVHCYAPSGAESTPGDGTAACIATNIQQIVERHSDSIRGQGGSCHSRHLPVSDLSEIEAGWVDGLEREFSL